MATQMCLVSVRSANRGADLAVPAHLPLCDLLPSVAEVVGEDVCGRDMRLARVDGAVLDLDRSLAECGVCDGDVLMLTNAVEPTPPPRFDLCGAVAREVSRADPGTPATHPPIVALLWSAVAVGALLGRSEVDPMCSGVGIACAVLVLSLAAALMVRRHRSLSVTLGLIASAFAGLAALLAVPGLPGFLLAMSAVSAVALGVWRVIGCAAQVFLPLAGVTMAAAAASLPSVLGWLPQQGIGPVLTTVSVAILAVSPRLAARMSGLDPTVWIDDIEVRATRARRIMADILATTGAAAALGTVMTAVLSRRTLVALCFVAAVAVTLLLRSRTHPEHAAALMISAGAAASTAVGLAAVTAPRAATSLCGTLIVGAAVTVALGVARPRPSPAASRVLTAVEFAAGAAVIPLACAAAGLFSTIRSVL
ncbi:MAG: type VII secretion integral membrane protein EccD [Mycobacterium sp.]